MEGLAARDTKGCNAGDEENRCRLHDASERGYFLSANGPIVSGCQKQSIRLPGLSELRCTCGHP